LIETRPAAPKVARARSSDAGEITYKPMLIGYARVPTVEPEPCLAARRTDRGRVRKDFHRADVRCCCRPAGFT
jgi:hypothetical protein